MKKTAWLRVTQLYGCGLILFCLLTSHATALVIDDFSVGSINLLRGATAINQTQNGLDSTHVVGGSRSFLLGQFGSSGQSAVVDANAKTFTFSAGDGPGYLDLNYGSAGQPLNLDLLAGGNDKLVMTVLNANPASSINGIGMRIFAAPAFSARVINFTQSLALPGGVTRRVALLSQFNDLDLTNVRQLELSVGRYFGSFTLLGIQTVPEPSSVVMGAIGLAGLLALAGQRGYRKGRLVA